MPKDTNTIVPNRNNLTTLPDGKYKVEQNLFFFVRSEGTSRIFVFRYQFANVRREISLGQVPPLTITSAKAEATKCRALLAKGIDPKTVREENRRKHKDKTLTFEDFAESTLPEIIRLKHLKPATITSWKGPLKNHILPVIGKLPLVDITSKDICKILNPIWETKTTIASRIRGQLEAYFTMAKRKGLYHGENPAMWKGNLEALFPPPSRIHMRKHQKAFSVEALRDQIQISLRQKKSVHYAFVFGALTATRQREFNDAKWDEIDFDDMTWTVPPERRKDGKPDPFVVPLSRQAAALLKSMPRQNEYLFPGSYYNNRAVSRYYVSTLVLYASGGSATMHGCRSTFRDWAAKAGADRVVAEKCLMHSLRSVEESYQRDSLIDLRRELLQAWADEILPMEKLDTLI